jgi:hypothetical protein
MKNMIIILIVLVSFLLVGCEEDLTGSAMRGSIDSFKELPVNYCEDSDANKAYPDGINPFEYGWVTYEGIKYDECIDNLLYENFCAKGLPYVEKIDCEFGCFNGKCLEPRDSNTTTTTSTTLEIPTTTTTTVEPYCTETDNGDDPDNFGIATGYSIYGPFQIADECDDENTLIERECWDGASGYINNIHLCPCLNGECVQGKARVGLVKWFANLLTK